MLHKLQTLEKELQTFYNETEGDFLIEKTAAGNCAIHYSDYVGGAIDAINNLIGVIEKDER